jgi:hypothetical protein
MVYWFEGPFPLIPTPFAALPKGEEQDVFNKAATGELTFVKEEVTGLRS